MGTVHQTWTLEGHLLGQQLPSSDRNCLSQEGTRFDNGLICGQRPYCSCGPHHHQPGIPPRRVPAVTTQRKPKPSRLDHSVASHAPIQQGYRGFITYINRTNGRMGDFRKSEPMGVETPQGLVSIKLNSCTPSTGSRRIF